MSIAERELRLAAASRLTLERANVARVELYHRLSRTIRVTHEIDGADEHVSCRSGVDEGTALRLWSKGERGVRFTAVSGSSEAAIVDAADRALRGPLADAAHEPGPGGERADDHDDVAAPDEATLRTWLADARQRVEPWVDRAWVEAAETRETWVVDGHVHASRARARGWAVLDDRAPDASAGGPLILASREWNRLDADEWALLRELRGDRAPGARAPAPGGVPLLLLSPECAATLVLTLVRAVSSFRSEIAVGPGFRVTDAPDERRALFGGAFDDLGFPTSRQTVADGRSLGPLTGPGRYRRPSFRDAPVALPAHLVVEPADSAPPEDRWSVRRLTIHALSAERWVLEVDATLFRGGAPLGSVLGAHVATGPRELLAGCIAGVGESFALHRGVRTPALLFEGLAVRP